MKYLSVCALFLVLSGLVGCGSMPRPQERDPVRVTGSAVVGAQAHTVAAKEDIKVAVPQTNELGKVSLKSADQNLDAALVKLDEANKALDAEQNAKADLVYKLTTVENDLTKLKGSWGVQLQRWATIIMWGVVALVVLHVGLRVAGLWVTGPVGAALAIAGTIINPFGWMQAICDNLYFRRAEAKKVV
jgi:hypothetical protein